MKPRPAAGPAAALHYRVGELIRYLHELFARDNVLSDVWVAGEMVDVTRSAAGHYYFTLRDGDARIGVVLFRSSAQRQQVPLAEGHSALVHGAIDIYDARSVYQLVADIVLPGDTGRMKAQFEELRTRLDKEGLFAPERKRALPRMPRRIGLATSSTGAAIHDILRVWERRFPMLEVIVAPTPVQGDEALQGVVMAMDRLARYHRERLPLDFIILTRGGGAPEELALFNEEAIARAIFACPIPVVSAIGHEVDWTIADLVADLRAPTPSAAAEMVVPDIVELHRQVAHESDRARMAMRRRLGDARSGSESLSTRLGRRSPSVQIQTGRTRTDDLAARGLRSLRGSLGSAWAAVESGRLRLGGLNPEAILARGYALCSLPDSGALLTDSSQVGNGDRVDIHLAHGRVLTEVLDTRSAVHEPPPANSSGDN
jgi:exodeoxyribonuclease VII large subunit